MVGKYNPQIHHRRSIRLKHYDYNQAGAYFVTICIQYRECLLGDITNKTLQLNEYGEIVKQIWNHLPHHFKDVEIDAAVIMPNHFHGIIIITDRRRGLVSQPSQPSQCTGLVSKPSPKPDRPFYNQKTKLGKIVAYFKYQTTKLINQQRNAIGVKVWQRNYYEHIIRNEKSLQILRQYVRENPLRWNTDQLHPSTPSKW